MGKRIKDKGTRFKVQADEGRLMLLDKVSLAASMQTFKNHHLLPAVNEMIIMKVYRRFHLVIIGLLCNFSDKFCMLPHDLYGAIKSSDL